MSTREKGLQLIASAKALIVNTVGLDGYPNARVLYSHASDGFVVYFSAGAESQKVREIAANPKVNAYYENTAQELPTWKNVVIYGEASPLEAGSAEYAKAVALISAKSPNFAKRAREGQLGANVLIRISPRKVKVLDFAADPKVEAFELDPQTDW
jgi:pyridoxine/pyridoxamine 5'-phosphate oxidase